MSTTYDILGLGVLAVDDLLYAREYPPADVKTRLSHRERQCGGLTGAALIAAARLGATCAYAGMLAYIVWAIHSAFEETITEHLTILE